MATNKITLNELRSIVRQVINEEIKVNYMDGKKFIIENQVSNNPTVQNLEKKAFSFFNDPKVTALLTKELDKLSPEQKEELSKKALEENVGNDFGSFKSVIEKAIQKNDLSEDMHDTIRGIAGYKPGEDSNDLDKKVGKVIAGFGQFNLAAMGSLPALSAMALDYFGGTDIINTLSSAVGSSSLATGLAILAGFIGGGILWKLGNILQNKK